MNRRILVQSGFIGSFDLLWSEWSRITDPDPNHPKGPHPWIPKTVLYSGFHAVDSEFQVRDSGFFVSGRDSGLQSLAGFRIPWSVFRIPKPRISDSTRKISRIPQEKFSGFQNSDSLTRGEPKVSMATNDNTGLRTASRTSKKNNGFYKQNNSFARASHFFVHFFSRFCTTSTWKCLISRFMENVNKQRRNLISLSELGYGLKQFNFKRVCLNLAK